MNNSKKLKWYGIPAIGRFLAPHKGLLLLIILTMGSVTLIESAFPLFQQYAITHFIGANTVDTMGLYILAYLVVLFVETAINYVGCYSTWKAEIILDRDIRKACFDHVQTLSFGYFNQNSVGQIHARVMADPEKIGMLCSWGLFQFILNVGYIIGCFTVMMFLNVRLALLLLLVAPVEFVLAVYFQRKLREENHKVREMNSKITGDINEGITGARTIKSLVIEQRMQKDFEEDTKNMRRISWHAGILGARFRSSITFVTSVALALVLWQGGYLTMKGLVEIGTLSVFCNYTLNLSVYVKELAATLARLVDSQVNIERVLTLLETPSDVSDSPEVIARYGDSFHPKKENWEELNGSVAFEDVTFQYPDGDEEVLSHFNLEIPNGSMIAIVGETGAGKSTLVNLICRFYEPTSGRVLIDGRDARERSQLWLHSHIGYVLQTPHLFSGSVLENMRYGNPDASMAQIEEACRRVCADKVISRMKDGYNSEVGEGGDFLSTGEKQLLSFARALLADPRILVLDEATSSVDTLTEQLIQTAIAEITRERTSFVIAHRLSTIRSADLILVMQDGKIVERGTHEELMARQGYYHRLYTTQYKDDLAANALKKKQNLTLLLDTVTLEC